MDTSYSAGTSSLLSTTSNLSSPMESIAETSDWSRAERLTFVPPPPNSQCSDGQSFQGTIRMGHVHAGAREVGEVSLSSQPSAIGGCSQPQQKQRQAPASQSEWMQHILMAQKQQQQQANMGHCQQQQQEEGGQQQRGIGGISGMKSLWERRIWEENVQRQASTNGPQQPFLFPKWRSVDALTASLVASSVTPKIIPRDSRIPEQRQEKLLETERMARVNKVELQKPFIQMNYQKQKQRNNRLKFGPRHFQTLGPEEMAALHAMSLYQQQQQHLNGEGAQWYDPEEIRQSIAHESIANVDATRQKWERSSCNRE